MPPTTIERLARVELNGLGEHQQGTLIERLGKVEQAALGKVQTGTPIERLIGLEKALGVEIEEGSKKDDGGDKAETQVAAVNLQQEDSPSLPSGFRFHYFLSHRECFVRYTRCVLSRLVILKVRTTAQ